jgi:hypothetical protein
VRHVSVDLKTFGRRPGCAILSIGAVEFSEEKIGRSFYRVIEEPQGTVDMDTLTWWLRQPELARKVFDDKEDAVDHATAIQLFYQFFLSCGARYLWCHASFDEPILKGAVGHAPVPWDYHDVRDLRTLVMLAKIKSFKPKGEGHNALDDARYQASQAIACFKRLNWKG